MYELYGKMLILAVKAKNIRLVMAILEEEPRAALYADLHGYTALHNAVAKEYFSAEIVNSLLASGASPQAASKRGTTPYDIALTDGNEKIFRPKDN
jgi:ankyrin repeat protein